MKNDPVSIRILLTPLNAAMPQNIWRHDLTNPAISDFEVAYSSPGRERPEKIFLRVSSTIPSSVTRARPVESIDCTRSVSEGKALAKAEAKSDAVLAGRGICPGLPELVMIVPPSHITVR